MKFLTYLIRCGIWGHEASESDEDKVSEQQYFTVINTDCMKCGCPVKIWIEPDCNEEYYMIQEGA